MIDGIPIGRRERRPGRRLIAWGVVVLVATASLLPVVVLLLGSLDLSGFHEPFRPGLDGWSGTFSSDATLASMGNSLLLSLRVPIALAVGCLLAYAVARYDIPGRGWIEAGFWAAFFVPTLPMAMGWLHFFEAAEWSLGIPLPDLKSFTGILWVHLTATTIPFMAVLLAPAFRQVDTCLEDAARVAGARTGRILSRINLPLVAPALATVFIAATVKSLETFEIEQLLGVPVGIDVYATRVYDLVRWDPPRIAEAMALSSVFLAILMVLAAIQYAGDRRNRPELAVGSGMNRGRRRSRWSPTIAAVLYAYLIVTVVLPLAFLVTGTFQRLFGFFGLEDGWTVDHWVMILRDARFGSAALFSVGLATTVAAIAVPLFGAIAWHLARGHLPAPRLTGFLTWLPWAFPGFILGMILMVLFIEAPPLRIFYGTAVPLVIGLLIKDMPIAVHLFRSAITNVPASLEEAARCSGAGRWTVLGRIVAPLVAPSTVAVALLVLAATLRDISTIVLLGAPGTRTLSLLMFDYATDGNYESASVIGIIVTAGCLAATFGAFRITRAMNRWTDND